MNALLLLAAGYRAWPIYWHLPILLVVISLVYSATRYDQWSHILLEAVRWVVRLGTFLVAIEAALWVLDRCI